MANSNLRSSAKKRSCERDSPRRLREFFTPCSSKDESQLVTQVTSGAGPLRNSFRFPEVHGLPRRRENVPSAAKAVVGLWGAHGTAEATPSQDRAQKTTVLLP